MRARHLFATMACVWSFAGSALAQPAGEKHADEATALLERGRSALAAGKTDEACTAFDEAVARSPSSEALLESGQCAELRGKTATAYDRYTKAFLAARNEPESPRGDRARALAAALAPRLSKLRIDVMAPVPGEVVKRSGVLVEEASWGALVPVDPGAYVVSASAPGHAERSIRVVVKADADAQVVVVPDLRTPPKAPPPASTGLPPVKSSPSPAPPGSGVHRTESPIGVAAFVTTSFGLLGLTLGTVFGVMSINEAGGAEEDPALCPNKVCTKAGKAVVDEAATKGTISTVAFAVGGTSLATGIVLFLVKELVIEKKSKAHPPKKSFGDSMMTLHFD